MQRRTFLATLAVGLAAEAVGIACSGRAALAPASPPVAPGPPPPGLAVLELNGELAGWAEVHGGSAIEARGVPDITPGHAAPTGNPPRQYRDLIIAAGPGLSDAFYRWASSCLLTDQPAVATGSVMRRELGGGISQLRWRGRVVGLDFPALDRARCAPVTLQVRVRIEAATEGTADALPTPPTAVAGWSGCRFRLGLPGAASDAVQAVGPFRCRRDVHIAPTGEVVLLAPRLSPLQIRPAVAAGAASLTLEAADGSAERTFPLPPAH